MTLKLIVSILFSCAILSCDQNPESEEILFVCTHGAARSPIAAAYFNKFAKENDLNFHAVFRGTEPDEILSKQTLIGLTEDGFDVSSWKPEGVSTQDVETAYKIVTFDCSVSSDRPSDMTIEWNGTPSISKDYVLARDIIRENVEELVEFLKNE